MKTEKIDKRWGTSKPEEAVHTFNFEPIKKYYFNIITKDDPSGEQLDWDVNKWTVRKIINKKVPFDRFLSLGCGFGFLERFLHSENVFKECDAWDISKGAISEAKSIAKLKGITNINYEIKDLEKISIKNKYDLIWANGAMHHINNLDNLIGNIHNSLNDDGYFICNEYIVSNHQKLSQRHLEVINAAIHLIPHEMRGQFEASFTPSFFRRPKIKRAIWELIGIFTFRNSLLSEDTFQRKVELSGIQKKAFNLYRKIKHFQMHEPKRFKFGKVFDHDKYYFKKVDPTECVNSSQIIPTIKKFFTNVDIRYYNGSIIHYAIDPKFIRSFNPNSEKHNKILQLLIEIENALIEIDDIRPIFAHIIAKK